MGTSTAFSIRSMKAKCMATKDVALKLFIRTCMLFLLGLSLNSGSCESDLTNKAQWTLQVHKFSKKRKELSFESFTFSVVKLAELRIPGVLQRLALCYILTAMPHVFVSMLFKTGFPASAVTFLFLSLIYLVLGLNSFWFWLSNVSNGTNDEKPHSRGSLALWHCEATQWKYTQLF